MTLPRRLPHPLLHSPARRRLVVFAGFTLGAYFVEQLLAGHFAARDPIAAAIHGSLPEVLGLGLLLAGLRVFLLFFAPCWGAVVVASSLVRPRG